ncbi:MAG: arginine--tRNA ligase [Rickettsiales bacterium]
MLNIFQIFRQQLNSTILDIAQKYQISITENELKSYAIEPTKELSFGDVASNIAMYFAKKFQLSPKDLANQIINQLDKEYIEKIEIAGAGFINIFLKNQIFYKVIESINQENEITLPNLGNNIKVNIEYASPNPTGPMHVGHTRGAIFGDVMAKLMQKVGYDVLKEYYINDAGGQINTLIKSAYIRYLQALGVDVNITENLYPGEYLIQVGEEIKKQFGDSLGKMDFKEYFPKIRDLVLDEMLKIIKSDLQALGIFHDSYFSEKKQLHNQDKITKIIDFLHQKNLIYIGKLSAPKTEKGVGAIPEGYDDQDQTLFRSSDFGDDQDRVVLKSDGSPTYFGADLAYLKSKFDRGARIFIMPLGYDHAGYVKRLTSACNAITDHQAQLKIILCQMVKFVKDGEPLKMSKRAGNFITAKQVLDEIGADALRFIMLTRKNDAPFDFDLNKVVEQSKDNPIFYVQYAHTRCCSVIRNLKNENPEFYQKIFENNQINLKNISSILENLDDQNEINLIKKIANYIRIIEMAVHNYEPHKIAFYLQDLSAEFHSLWNKGVENPNLKFILVDDFSKTCARMLLINSVKKIIANGLEIFNIKALEYMN